MPSRAERPRLPAGIDPAVFLRDYWQKRPLLMRAALPPRLFTVHPDELAGLACEPGLESRLVRLTAGGDWTLREGPFDDEDFAALPETGWTLLVQDVDKYLPEVAEVADRFDFVPGWRVDDVMISYAVDGGGVGPHVDAYDVFLIQARGRRRWRLDRHAYTEDDLQPDCALRVLARFDVDEEWILAPGDVLYLPPGVAHWGTAEGDCMTWSLGFRSPDRRELAADWFAWLADRVRADGRLEDPPGIAPGDPGHIPPDVATMAARLLAGLPGPGSTEFARWIGCHFTEPKPQFQIEPAADSVDRDAVGELLASGRGLRRHPFARLAWGELPDGRIALFCQGRDRELAAGTVGLARLLCDQRRLANPELRRLAAGDRAGLALLASLINEGVLEVDPE